MQEAARAIVFALENEILAPFAGPILLMGAHASDLRTTFPDADISSPFAGDHSNVTDLKHYQTIILFPSLQKDAAAFQMATALQHLAKDGLLVTSASNDAGGKSLPTLFNLFDLPTADFSKHKCRVVWARHTNAIPTTTIEKYLHAGRVQTRSDGLWTQPGVFCWDRTDKGSQLLKQHIPADLKGHIADFGAGIGELGIDILAKNPAILSLMSLEHDRRALDCAVKNIGTLADRHIPLWQDIHDLTVVNQFDAIIMNPPFHDGKATRFSLGEQFIVKAAAALKKKGRLFLVANGHLMYERLIAEQFISWQEVAREGGFKIITAIR